MQSKKVLFGVVALSILISACGSRGSENQVITRGGSPGASATVLGISSVDSSPIQPIKGNTDRSQRLTAHEASILVGYRQLSERFSFNTRYLAAMQETLDMYLRGFFAGSPRMSAEKFQSFRQAVAQLAMQNGRFLEAYNEYMSCVGDPIAQMILLSSRSRVASRQTELVRLMKRAREIRNVMATPAETAIEAGQLGRVERANISCRETPTPDATQMTVAQDPITGVWSSEPSQGQGSGLLNINPALGSVQRFAQDAGEGLRRQYTRQIEAVRRENEELNRTYAAEMNQAQQDAVLDQRLRAQESARLAERRRETQAAVDATCTQLQTHVLTIRQQTGFVADEARADIGRQELEGFETRLFGMRQQPERISNYRASLVQIARSARSCETSLMDAAEFANWIQAVRYMGRMASTRNVRLRALHANLLTREWQAQGGMETESVATASEVEIGLSREQLAAQAVSPGAQMLITACGAPCQVVARVGSSIGASAMAESQRQIEGIPWLRQVWAGQIWERLMSSIWSRPL